MPDQSDPMKEAIRVGDLVKIMDRDEWCEGVVTLLEGCSARVRWPEHGEQRHRLNELMPVWRDGEHALAWMESELPECYAMERRRRER